MPKKETLIQRDHWTRRRWGQFKKIWHEQIAAEWPRSQVLSGIKTKLRNTTVRKAPLNLTRNIINPQFTALEQCHQIIITYIWLS